MQASSTDKRIELISVQYLRGIAALMVVVYHLVSNSGLYQPERIGSHALFLNAGVDIFFVISGFIMWHTTRGRDVTPLRFMTDRIIRIAPLYWAVTLAVLAIAFFAPNVMRTTTFNLEYGLQSLFFIPAYHPVFTTEFWPVIVPGWSLNYEMFFYVIFALGLMMPARFAIAFLICAFTAIFAVTKFIPGPGLHVFYGDEMIFEFLFGVLLAEAVAKGFALPKAVCAALVIVGFSIIAASAFYDANRILKWALPSLAIVSGAVLYERAAGAPNIPALKLIGDSSYSLYLIHGLVIAAASKVLAKIIPADAGWLGTAFGSAFIIAAALAAGYAGHLLIEKPASAALKKALKIGAKKPPRTFAAAI